MGDPLPSPPPPKGGLSLYDNLLDPKDKATAATISSAPVRYEQTDSPITEPAVKKSLDPSLQFQPIRRPQIKQTKLKSSFPKAGGGGGPPQKATAAAATATALQPPVPNAAPPRSSLADWTATEDDEWRYGTVEKRQRGGRRKKKKKEEQVPAETDWDELYNPTRPTNVDEYLRSEEKIDEVREWKALLYRHRRRRADSDLSDDEDESRPAPSNQFAPPPSYSFAPPPVSPPAAAPSPPPPPPPPPPPDDATGDDAFQRRLALSKAQHPPPPPPPHTDSSTISRAPVRYAQPAESSQHHDDAADDDDEAYSPPPTIGSSTDNLDPPSRSNRPGQKGFAARLMSKYGWTQGSGLGADESGIVNPLRVQVEKRRRKADADGGGWAEPGGKAKIIGSKRNQQEESKFGSMSEVIVLRNMLENMGDLQAEVSAGLGQEIGEECGEKYGRVERLYIDVETRQVFIKFTDQVSALRAVNELEGRIFNGNIITPKFYDTEKFERGVYS